jgi:hypothetical protein
MAATSHSRWPRSPSREKLFADILRLIAELWPPPAAVSTEALDCFASHQREVRLDDNKIHIFGARRAKVTDLGAREPHVEDLALPKSVESGNLGLNKAVIRWMSV